MKWLLLFVSLVSVSLHADAPWIPNVRVSTDLPWDTLNQGESCLAVWGDTIVSICNTAERSSVPIAPYSYSFDAGQTFTQIPFTDNTTGIVWHTDPVIAVDDSGHVHMLIQYSLNEIRHYLSRDGGQSWSDTTRVTPSYGVDKPWMVVNQNEVYVVWQQIDGMTGIWLAKSTDYGANFTTSRFWERTYLTALCMDENENLHLALVDYSSSNVYYRKSTDKGDTWSNEVYLSDWTYVSSYGDRAPLNSIAARGDVVFLTWVDNSHDGSWDILGVRSTDGGTTWGSPSVVNDITSGGQCKGWVHFDEHGGLHLVYYHTPDWPTIESSPFSFRYQYSPDSGATFNPSIRVSDGSYPSLANFIGEYHICVSDSQYLYTIWADGRNGDDNDLYFSKALLSHLSGEMPMISIYDYEWLDSGADSVADPGDTLSLTVVLSNSGIDASAVDVVISTNDPFATLIDSSSSYGAMLSDSVADNSSDPFVLHIQEGAPVHMCTLEVTTVADGLVFRDSILIIVGIPPVLLIDDDGGDTYENYFAQSLNRIGVVFNPVKSDDDMMASMLSDYQVVIWLTGDNSSPIDSSDALALSDYLDSGGNLFVTGQDVEGCADSSFYEDYLHADLVEDDAYRIRIEGVPGDPIGDGLTSLIIGAPGADNQERPSIIFPVGGADSIFYYRIGGAAGIKYEGTYKVVYFSFGFEAIASVTAADTTMFRILRWFGVPVGVEEVVTHRIPVGTTLALRAEPNPFGTRTNIEYWVPSLSTVELGIYDAAGRMVREVLREPKTAGLYRTQWYGRDSTGRRLPSGVYFCRLTVGDWIATRKMVLVRYSGPGGTLEIHMSPGCTLFFIGGSVDGTPVAPM